MENNNCIHCGTDCGKTPIIWNTHQFCCNGCQQVFQLLNEHKLHQYYEYTAQPGIKAENETYQNKYAFLDKEDIKQKLYEFIEAEIAKVTFNIPAIHCVSCIWLLEHLNKLNAGIKHSSVNFINKTYTVSFNTTEISLRQLVELLVSIHYIPDLSLQTLENKGAKTTNNRSLIYKMGVAGFIFGNVMMYSLPQYFNGKPLNESLGPFLNYLSLFLTIPLLFYSGSDYFISALKGLKNKIINIDLPIALGLLALFIITAVEVLGQTGQGYSDSISGLLFFLLIGKWYQSKTYEALAFDRDYKSYFPVAVTKINNNAEQSILLEEIKKGDELLIRNKELIPVDSILLSGTALIDYSFVTGESTPVKKSVGDFLYAGGIQNYGSISIKVENEVSQSHLTKLWNQGEDKKQTNKSITPIIDRISIYFTLIIILLAIAGFMYWYMAGQTRVAVLVLSSVLIVTCPCALALSLPFTFGNAMRMLGLNGLYIKNVHVIEKLTKINTLVFDKTGTITVPDTNSIQFIGEQLTSIELQAVVSLAKQSTHPLSNAITKHFNTVEALKTKGYVEVMGKGIYANINNLEVKIGSSEYMNDPFVNTANKATVVYVSINNVVKGYFKIGNKYRNGFHELMQQLSNHFNLYLLSGDHDGEREYLLQYFKSENMLFNQQPTDKRDYINNLHKKGCNILMTGDGLNDAGAFMQSNVAISVADDIYHFSPAADAIIDASNYHRLYHFILYTRKALFIVKISFAISFLYNIVGLYFALTGTLSPVVAAILMPVSSVSVVAFATFGTRWAARNLSKNTPA